MEGTTVEASRNALLEHLGINETANVTLLAQATTEDSTEIASSKGTGSKQRILAVVTNYQRAEEEGSILVFKPWTTSDNELDVLLLWAAPLTSELSISMAQSRARSGTLDLRPGRYKPVPSPQMILSLDLHGQKQSFVVNSTEELRSFISESRRLIKISNAAAVLDFGWLDYYKSQCKLRRELPRLYPRPDLRELQKPTFSHLSRAFAGQPGDEDLDIARIRDEWILTEMDKAKDKYSKPHTIKVRIGTFNVNGKLPSQDLSPWIRPQHQRGTTLPPLKAVSPLSVSALYKEDYLSAGRHDEESIDELEEPSDHLDETDPDIIVLGFQELDLSTEALIYSYTTTREDAWVEAILASLGEVRDQYAKLASKQLVGMLVVLIVKKELLKHTSNVRTCSVGTGIMGMMGNKGAVALQVILYSTVVTFVNAHLAAFDEYTEKRNADFHDLSQRLVFSTEPSSGSGVQPSLSGDAVVSGPSTQGQTERAFHSDILFWMGDLNYRVDLPDTDVRELVGTGPREYNIRDMLEHDQLTKSMREGRAFEGFHEGLIRHNPTYRFSPGIATDALGYDMKRRPAWTDRILYMSNPSIHIKQLTYNSHFEITMSDHRPVSASFTVPVRAIDEHVFNDQASELLNRLGDFEDSVEVPKLKVDMPEIDFGQVWYRKKYTRKLRLENIGKVTCAFRFIPLNEEDLALPEWLRVSSHMGIILPNEHVDLTLTVFVDDVSANIMNLAPDKMQHTLILHTVRGKDNFVIVTGNYQATSFANDLEILVRLPGPIRHLCSGAILSTKPKSNVPNEVIRLINWLMTNGIEIPNLYATKGKQRTVEFIRECLDTGHEFIFGTSDDKTVICLSFGEALLQMLQSLPVALVPTHLHERCSFAKNRDEAFEIISELPGHSLNVWISLTAYLHYYVQQQSQRNSEDDTVVSSREIIACIFAPILMRDDIKVAHPITPLAKRRFLAFFLQ